MAEANKSTAPAKKPVPPTVKKAASKTQEAKKHREMLAEFMSTGIDFSPFTIDAGDGIEWAFSPDPMPADTEKLQKAMEALKAAGEAGEGMSDAFGELVSAVRDRLIDDKQKKDFPKPIYGQNAIMFFAMHLATGRDGLPTEED